MTVCIQKRDRCRLCFSLILRDRSTLSSSICCQKYYHLFKNIQRTKIPLKKFNPFKTKISNRTVCFRDLVLRYLRTQIEPIKNFSNLICYDCSMILLDIEQCAKYLRRTINQLKIKLNKSNRLITSSLSATCQKKTKLFTTMKNQTLPTLESDDDEEFDDIDDDDEESDEENDNATQTNLTSSNTKKSLDFASSSSAGVDNSNQMNSKTKINNNGPCNDNNNDDDDDDDDDGDGDDEDDDADDDDEDGLVKTPKTKTKKSPENNSQEHAMKNFMSNLNLSGINPSDPMMINLFRETNPHMFQLHLAHLMANSPIAASIPTGGQNNNIDTNNVEGMMNTLANIQRNFLFKVLSDPRAAAQVGMLANQMKVNIQPMPLIGSNNKQAGSGRKRKSTPEKRVITNYQPTNNNGDASPTTKHESMNSSVDNINNQDLTDHPLELTLKSHQTSNRVSASPDVQNLVISRKKENGSPAQFYQHIDEDLKESTTPNDSSVSLASSSINRHSTVSKRPRVSTSGQYDSTSSQNNSSMMNLTQITNDLVSPNHHQTAATTNDDNNANLNQRQQRKLDPLSCSECGKVLFNDKNLLLHRQTHAKNEKQCWICGVHDDAIKKHIINEHGNQKITNTGFKCQHCEKVFPVFADLETHTKDHTKKKPFECPICNKRFGQQGNLSCHLRIHSGVKPFTCAHCGKAFRHSNSLRRHARTVHSASRGLTTPNSLLLPSTTTSLSNDLKSEPYDDGPSGLMIPSDDGSSSTGGIPSPSVSNAQVDSD